MREEMCADVPDPTPRTWMMTQPRSQKTSMEYRMLIRKMKETVDSLAMHQAAPIEAGGI